MREKLFTMYIEIEAEIAFFVVCNAQFFLRILSVQTELPGSWAII